MSAMSVTSPLFEPPSALPPPYPVRQFSVAEYHRLGEAGVLAEDEPVELLEGWIVPKMMRNPPHDATIELVEAALRPRLPEGWRVRVQSAVTTLDSEPEPDLVVVRGEVRDYLDHHPGPGDVALVVEVAESSLDRDRQKLRVYARAGIPVVWIVNLVEFRVEVYDEPDASAAQPRYKRQKSYTADGSVPLVVQGKRIAAIPAGELLP
jgi:Uma2 family endonuclease